MIARADGFKDYPQVDFKSCCQGDDCFSSGKVTIEIMPPETQQQPGANPNDWNFELVTHRIETTSFLKLARELLLMLVLALPFLGLFAGFAVNLFRWITEL
jgi:hypothetical protein